jgi:ABC-type branched-subunit amino acid transport system permease subunit
VEQPPDETRAPEPSTPPDAPGAEGPRIGVDEWVARSGERTSARTGLLAPLLNAFERIPPWGVLALSVGAAALIPFVSDSDYVVRVAVNTVLFALLALGLNVVVGWAGLLDLGFIAFYGFGAYLYAMLSSSQFDLHLPALLSIAIVVVSSALLGLLLGLPSRRLLGDYLAIVTLFWAQIYVVLATNADRITLPWNDGPTDFSGGPNGITDVDPISILGYEFNSIRSYLWLSLGVFAVVVVALSFVNRSRTGRAWRALREDALAAELMSMPVNRLKLLAFMFGAATAGLTGTIFASVQLGVFPQNFDLPLLITVYAMVILGGAGSIPGVVIGAITINVVLELLRDPDDARTLFYVAILLGLVALIRPWKRLAAVLAGTLVFGVVVYQLADRLRPEWVSGSIEGDRLEGLLEGWVIHPEYATRFGNIGFVLLIAAVLVLSELRGLWRTILLVPTLYLAAFVWENRLVAEPSVTRILLLGALLIVLMTWRPQGLLGTARVEVV